MSNFDDPRAEPVLVPPGAFNRKLPVRENVVLAILPPYLALARTLARASRRKRRLDWGGLWNVSEKRGGFSIAGPAVGASNSVIMLESLIANGAKRVIAVGCCGSLQPNLEIGELVVPIEAVSEEGVSAHYRPDLYPPVASYELVEIIEKLAGRKGWNIRKGAVWTTDAPYRETHEKVKRFSDEGVLAVEMELSALFTVARFRGIKLAGVMAVSDELASLEWKKGFFRPAFLQASSRAVRLALKAFKNALR